MKKCLRFHPMAPRTFVYSSFYWFSGSKKLSADSTDISNISCCFAFILLTPISRSSYTDGLWMIRFEPIDRKSSPQSQKRSPIRPRRYLISCYRETSLPNSEKSAGKLANKLDFWYITIAPPTIPTGTEAAIDPKNGPKKVTLAKWKNLMLGGLLFLLKARMVNQKIKIPNMIIIDTKLNRKR